MRRTEKRGVEGSFPERSDNKRLARFNEENQAYEQRRQAEIEAAVKHEGAERVDETQLAPSNSYGHAFAMRGYYLPEAFVCKSCGRQQIWTPQQQKWWYEIVKGNPYAGPSRCRPCRAAERERKDEARRVHLDGAAKKQGKL